ncbi:hypothetical protein ACS0TY_001338 [Phlomoides rotata]
MEEDFVDDCYSVETDDDYEFDASHFYDFTRPENDSEIQEVERWFEVSGDYPHSPFVVKLNLEKILFPEVETKSDSKNTSCDGDSHSKRKGKEKANPMLQDAAKSKTKLTDKSSKSSTFMEPTASHLAKLLHKAHGQKHLCTRFQRTSARLDQMRNCVGSDNLATKRQKLETGYLKKGSRLKHQFLLQHKSSKKVTVPREPELETQLRAQRRRSKNSCASSEYEKQKQQGYCNFKAHPPSRKILHARSLPQYRKRKPQSPDFQVPDSKTIQRGNRQSSAKENKLSAGDKLSENKLIGQFNELSLGSNHNAERHSSSKASDKKLLML